MKTTNIFYPEFLVMLYGKIYDGINSTWGSFFNVIFLLGIPFILVLISIWYVIDVIGNILEWICIKIFVDLPLWGLTKVVEHEEKEKGSNE